MRRLRDTRRVTGRDVYEGRVDLSRLAEAHDGYIGIPSGPDPRGSMPAPRDRVPATVADFLRGIHEGEEQ